MKKDEQYYKYLKIAKRYSNNSLAVLLDSPMLAQHSTQHSLLRSHGDPDEVRDPNEKNALDEGVIISDEGDVTEDDETEWEETEVEEDDEADYEIANIPNLRAEESFADSIKELLKKFVSYMTGPNRNRKQTSVEAVVDDVKRILSICGAQHDLEILFQEELPVLQKQYIEGYCKEKCTKAASIRKYLTSLRDFCKFLSYAKSSHDIDIPTLNNIDFILCQWKKKYRKTANLQGHKRKEDDFEMLVDRNQVKVYDEGKQRLEAKSLISLAKLSPGKVFCRREFCLIRDYLMVEIGLANAHRSGVVVNMKVPEFLKGKLVQDKFIISVWDHKTVESYGAAPVTIDQSLFDEIATFVKHIRPQVDSAKSENVFLSWNGDAVQAGYPSKRLHLMWERSGNFEGRVVPKKLCMNHLRKSVSTSVRENKSQHCKEVASTMMHSEKTAGMHYDIINQKKTAVIGANAIGTVFRGGTKRKNWTESEVNVIKKQLNKHSPMSEIKSFRRREELEASPRQIHDKIRRLDFSQVNHWFLTINILLSEGRMFIKL